MSKAAKLTETFTRELGLDKGYFDRISGTFLLWFNMLDKVLTISLSIMKVLKQFYLWSRSKNACHS